MDMVCDDELGSKDIDTAEMDVRLGGEFEETEAYNNMTGNRHSNV